MTKLSDLPRFIVLEPGRGVQLELHLDAPACEIDLSLERPKPGRSFIVLVGHPGGHFVQRARIAGSARIYFDPESPGDYVLALSNPMTESATLSLSARNVGSASPDRPRARSRRRGRPTTKRPLTRTPHRRPARRSDRKLVRSFPTDGPGPAS